MPNHRQFLGALKLTKEIKALDKKAEKLSCDLAVITVEREAKRLHLFDLRSKHPLRYGICALIEENKHRRLFVDLFYGDYYLTYHDPNTNMYGRTCT